MRQFNIVSKMHTERVNRIIANLEVANCVFPMAHGAKP